VRGRYFPEGLPAAADAAFSGVSKARRSKHSEDRPAFEYGWHVAPGHVAGAAEKISTFIGLSGKIYLVISPGLFRRSSGLAI